MKKTMIVFLVFVILNSSGMIQAESIPTKLISNYEEIFVNRSVIIETRLYQRYNPQFFVNFVKQSTNKSIYADTIIRLLHKYENGSFRLAAYDITDFVANNCFMLDRTKKMLFCSEIDKNEMLFNKRKKLEKIKAGRFNLDYYPLPYLGKKYLKNARHISDHVYEINKVKVREGLAVFLDLNKLISASYVVEESRIIETYRDESEGQMIRIIEVGSETINFTDLDTLARIAREKLEAYYPLSEETVAHPFLERNS